MTTQENRSTGLSIQRQHSTMTARTVRASPVPSPCARFPSVKAWSVCSRSTRPTSKASPWYAVAVCAAPSCTICGRAAVSRPVSPKTPHTSPSPAHRHKERQDEKRHPPRLPLHRRQTDRWYRCPNALDLRRRWRHPVARHRPLRTPGMDRWRHPPDGYRRPRVEVQKQIRRSGLLNTLSAVLPKAPPLEGGVFLCSDMTKSKPIAATLRAVSRRKGRTWLSKTEVFRKPSIWPNARNGAATWM